MIRLAVVNMAWQLGHNDLLLADVCKGADVVLACEALDDHGKAPEDLARILPTGWLTNQIVHSGAALAGSAVLWRSSVMRRVRPAHTVDGPIEASRKGIGVRARYLNPVLLTYRPTGDTRRYVPFHAPLRPTGRQGEFYRNLERYLGHHPHAVAGGDGNRPRTFVSAHTGRRAIGREVISVLLPNDVDAHGVRIDSSAYSDHPIVRLDLNAWKARR